MSDRPVEGSAFDADVRGQSVEMKSLDAGSVNTDAWEWDLKTTPATPVMRLKSPYVLDATLSTDPHVITATASGSITAGRGVFLTESGSIRQSNPRFLPERTHFLVDSNAGTTSPHIPVSVAELDTNTFGIAAMISGGYVAHWMMSVDPTSRRIIRGYSGTTYGYGLTAANYIGNAYDGCKLATNKHIIAVRTYSTNYPAVMVIDSSGTTPTFGTVASAESVISSYHHVCRRTDNEFIFVWGAGTALKIRYGTVSGTTVTWATAGASSIEASLLCAPGIDMIDADKALVTYVTSGGTLKGVVITCSGTGTGTTMSIGTLYSSTVTPNWVSQRCKPRVIAGGTKAITSYHTSSPIGLRVTGLSISGTTLTWSSNYVALRRALGYNDIRVADHHKLNDYQTLLHSGGIGYDNSMFHILEIPTGEDVVCTGTWSLEDASEYYYMSYSVIFTCHPLVGIFISFHKYIFTGTNYFFTNGIQGLKRPIAGIALETKTDGQSCKVQIGGIVTGLSSLTAGRTYYCTDAGVLTTDRWANHPVGVALSTTSLLLGGV